MNGPEWAALAIQAVAAVSAATAAVFAWLTARSIKSQSEYESRARASEHLKVIHRLISELIDMVHSRPGEDRFLTQMHLPAELGVTSYVTLPKSIELVDHAVINLTVQEFDRLASAAMEEVEQAQLNKHKRRFGRVTSSKSSSLRAARPLTL